MRPFVFATSRYGSHCFAIRIKSSAGGAYDIPLPKDKNLPGLRQRVY